MKLFLPFLILFTLATADLYPKVKVDIYMESLCPACKRLISTKLERIMEIPDLRPIIDLNIVPFGNGRIISEEPINIRCQHGEAECRGNIALLCGFDKYPEFSYEYAKCMESLKTQTITDNDILSCGSQAGFEEVQSVIDCFHSEEGDQLHLVAAHQTPAHKYVPWVVVDGVEVGDKVRSLKTIICKAYQGPAPDSCEYAVQGRRLRDIEEDINEDSLSYNNSTSSMSAMEFQNYIKTKIDEQFHIDVEERRNATLTENYDFFSSIKKVVSHMPAFKSFMSSLISYLFRDVE